MSGAKCVCTPPPKHKDNAAAVWRGVLDGTLDCFTSDHSPINYVDKIAGGPETPFTIPLGVPGIETRLPLLFSAADQRPAHALQQFAEITATRAAKLFGLYPRKGLIALGSDAVLAIWTPRNA